jgi:hypothetical protein
MIGSSQDLNIKHMEEKTSIWLLLWTRSPRKTTHASLRRQAWWWRRPPAVIPLFGRVPGRASGPSRSRVDDGDDLQYVSWKIDQVFRFSSPRRIYRRKGGVRRWPGGPTTWWRGLGAGRTTLWCGWPLAPLRLYFGLRLVSEKIGTLAFVSSNSENISCVAFLKHKNSRKQGTGTMVSH